MGAENFYVLFKIFSKKRIFSTDFAFLDKNFSTRRRFSDSITQLKIYYLA